MKINVVGSARDNPGLAGIGVVLRDRREVVLAARSIPLGNQTNNEVELRAASHSIQLALQLEHQIFVLETDSSLLVQWLHMEPWSWQLFNLLYDLTASLFAAQVQAVHIFCETNSVANALAKLASFTQSYHSFNSSTLP